MPTDTPDVLKRLPATDLREKLNALVEEWYEEEKEERIQGSLMIAATLRACRKQLAALLAESEPVKREGVCFAGQPSEAKAKLPLGHEFDDYGCAVRPCRGVCHVHGCGQPRSAHEPK